MSDEYEEVDEDPTIEDGTDEMTESEALAHSYQPPYPEAESVHSMSRYSDLQSGRACLIYEGDDEKFWWEAPGDGSTEVRNEAHVYIIGAISQSLLNISHATIELLPQHTLANLEASITSTVKQVDELVGSSPMEVEITPGMALFDLLKNNPGKSVTGPYMDRASLIKHMKENLRKQAEASEYYLNQSQLPSGMCLGNMAIMMMKDSNVITGPEFEQLRSLFDACQRRINALLTKPVTDSQSKLATAVIRTKGLA